MFMKYFYLNVEIVYGIVLSGCWKKKKETVLLKPL